MVSFSVFLGCAIKEIAYIHILFPLKETLAGWVKQQGTLYQIQCAEDDEVVLPITALCHETIERANQTQTNVPLKALLQLKELPKGRVLRKTAEVLARR